MHSLIFVIVLVGFCYSLIYTLELKSKNNSSQDNKYPALVLSLDRCRWRGYQHVPFLTACPASTQKEHKINQEISITGKSLFVRNVYERNDTVKLEFCDEPIEPAVVYNVEKDAYEIGYEIYREKDKIMPRKVTVSDIELTSESYHRYKSVDIHNRIINQSKPLNASSFVIELGNATNTEFAFTDGSSTMAFHWIPGVRNMIFEKYHKQIITNDVFDQFVYNLIHGHEDDHTERRIFSDLSVQDYNLKSKCQDFFPNKKQPNLHLFTTKNQKDPKQESATAERLHQPIEIRKLYGDMTLSQIIPLWNFQTFFGQLASCTNMNMMPIWTSIAEGQLKKVDLYLQAVKRGLDCDIKQLVFGVAGVLALHNDTDEKMFAFDTDNQQITPIPKIIYRVIEAECNCGYDDETGTEMRNAIIVIHNDPIGVSDEDRICQESEDLASWNMIKNNDPKTGVTYVCGYQSKKIISDKFGLIVRSDAGFINPLELEIDRRPRSWRGQNETERINSKFEYLLNEQV